MAELLNGKNQKKTSKIYVIQHFMKFVEVILDLYFENNFYI